MNMLAIVAFVMIIVLMVWLLKGKSSAVIPFVVVPIVAALVAGFPIAIIGKFAVSGMAKVGSVVILFMFSILYFGVMDDAGLFDKVVNKLVQAAGTDVTKIIVVTAAIAAVAHLDGAGSSTFLITIPAMMPIYKRCNINSKSLLLITGLTAGVMNVFPWGGPFIRVGTVLGIDPNIIWQRMIPMQLFGLVLCLLIAIYIGKKEKARGAGFTADLGLAGSIRSLDEQALALKRPNLETFNWILTAILLTVLFKNLLPSHLAFLIATTVALLVNYPNAKEQTARIKAHAPTALQMVVIIVAAGVFLGIFSDSKMVDQLVKAIVGVMPQSLGPVLHIVVGVFAAPLGMFIGADPYAYGLFPIINKITSSYGVDPISAAIAVVMGECVGWAISPAVSTTYLGLGLANVELKDHLKNAFFITWALTIVLLAFCVLTGAVAI